jgi:hypothetical protein
MLRLAAKRWWPGLALLVPLAVTGSAIRFGPRPANEDVGRPTVGVVRLVDAETLASAESLSPNTIDELVQLRTANRRDSNNLDDDAFRSELERAAGIDSGPRAGSSSERFRQVELFDHDRPFQTIVLGSHEATHEQGNPRPLVTD